MSDIYEIFLQWHAPKSWKTVMTMLKNIVHYDFLSQVTNMVTNKAKKKTQSFQKKLLVFQFYITFLYNFVKTTIRSNKHRPNKVSSIVSINVVYLK